jgi:hypothetical protein
VNLIHSCFKRFVGTYVKVLRTRFVHWTTPLTSSLPLGTLADLARSKSELLAENALLRQQLIILKRQVKRPACTKTDRILLELKSRKVIHVGVTRSPTDSWVAQQLREATPYGQTPKYLIRDQDSKFGPCFARVAGTSGIKILKTPYHAPRANAICERFLGSVRRECLDHILILLEKQLHRVLQAYVTYFNEARPHQGIQQQVPQGKVLSLPPDQCGDRIISVPVLGGLHHEYRKVA